MACSAAYDQVKEMDIKNPNTFQQHLLNNYKINASFEAEKMHDWNSAKLYSEKALRAFDGENIYPEKINYWKLSTEIAKDIQKELYGDAGEEGEVYESKLNNMLLTDAEKKFLKTKKEDRY